MNTPTSSPRTGQDAHAPIHVRTPVYSCAAGRHRLGYFVANVRGGDDYRLADAIGASEQEADERAAYIVRAVNSHAALVAALEAIVERKTVTKSLSCLGETPTTITAPALSHAECIRVAQTALAAARNA